jgi:hypothetical protein
VQSKILRLDQIVLDFDIDVEDFGLTKAQHTIAQMIGFRKWTDMLKASEPELELAKLLLIISIKFLQEIGRCIS